MNTLKAQKKLQLLSNNKIFLFIFLVYFIPRILYLGIDMANIDTMYWYPRIEKFPSKFLQFDFKGTYLHYHPGTTLLWLSGFFKLFFVKVFEFIYNYNPTYMPHHFTKIQFVVTFPLIAVISVLGVYNFYILKNLKNITFAIIFSILLSLEPFFLGVSKYFHVTALSTLFGLSAFLSIIYFTKIQKSKYLYVSGILSGLAVSTKISAIILQPIILIYFFYLLLLNYNFSKSLFSNFYKSFKHLITQFLILILTFFVVNPFMWVAPVWGLRKIYFDGVVGTGFSGSHPKVLFTNIPHLYYLETAFLRVTPLVFLAFLFTTVYFFLNIKKHYKNNFLVSIVIYFLFYYLLLSIPLKLKDRYLFELIPPLVLVATYGISIVYQKLRTKLKIIFIILYVIYIAFITYTYFPVYSFYHTELIGGVGGLYSMGFIPTNRGEWYAQAAFYLNKKDTLPEEKIVLMGGSGGLIKTFSQFYYGTTYAELGAIPDKSGLKINYIVTRKKHIGYVPGNFCKKIKSFGPRNFFGTDEIYIYECNVSKDDLRKINLKFPSKLN